MWTLKKQTSTQNKKTDSQTHCTNRGEGVEVGEKGKGDIKRDTPPVIK